VFKLWGISGADGESSGDIVVTSGVIGVSPNHWNVNKNGGDEVPICRVFLLGFRQSHENIWPLYRQRGGVSPA